MAVETTGSFISIDQSNINNTKSSVKQLVDIVQSDIASIDSTTRKSYEVFTSGATGLNSITSSLHQTVFDQDFTLGTSNPLFDITVGSLMEISGNEIKINGETSPNGQGSVYSFDGSGKLNDPGNNTAMVREKVNIYKQFAQSLLGDANGAFFTPHGAESEDDDVVAASGTKSKKIKGAIFICFRRLFTRDNIDKKSFGIRLHKKASRLYSEFLNDSDSTKRDTGLSTTNISIKADQNSSDGNVLYVADDSVNLRQVTMNAGEVSTLQDASGNNIGLIYYDSGIIVLDVERTFDATQTIRGIISAVSTDTIDASGPYAVYGYKNGEVIGDSKYYYPVYTTSANDRTQLGNGTFTFVRQNATDDSDEVDADTAATNIYYINNAANTATQGTETRPTLTYPLYASATSNYYSSITANAGQNLHNDKLYPSLWVSGTVDNVIDHICKTRFGRDNLSAITFRNETIINSSLVFCRAAPSQLNYSTNPTYKDSSGNIIATESNGEPFSYVTTIGLYDSENSLLAVAKTSRPIEKNPETDLSIRIRLDY